MPATTIEAIRGLERDRFRAMVEGDGAALDTLLAENVSYVHTNGKRETKRQFIDAITAGRRRYRQIEIQSQDVVPAGKDTCIVSGRALIEMESKNGALLFPIAYTAVHVQADAGQWQLLALQATRVALE
ncbi:nuclear transport factor 2 family protein [Caballeronia sp. BR00000012568055]|uniref:nuclear transport factor 2 family protein n=1 Tax=Caballeronia sp. BR00000012568055 TaxID=2918761 RepID=UPI0023F71ADE|nr:nuclear transport factor 2 family protein [Caballeronia sp. BR00000012568055]